MTDSPASLKAALKRHDELTQLDVTRTLRIHQKEWFTELRRQVIEEKRPYIISHALAPHEIYEALDVPYVIEPWYSGLVAAKRQSGHYSNVLDRAGYHPGLSRYTALTLGVILDNEEENKPWGGLPRPSLVVSGERPGWLISQYSDCPHFLIEHPSLRRLYPQWWTMSQWQWEDLDGGERIDLMERQFEELIGVAEKIAGKKLDRDRLAEIVARVNRQEAYFDDVRQMLATAPKLPLRCGEAMSQVMGIQWHRGSDWALDQARAFRDEVKALIDAESWVCPNEQYRLMYVGLGLWQNLEFFAEFEKRYGAVFVRSNYVGIAVDCYVRHGARNPVRALASRYSSISDQIHIPGLGGAWALHEARQHRVDAGLSIDGWWGSRMINNQLEAAGIPIMHFPADAVDSKGWDQEKLVRLVSEFIETRVIPNRRAAIC